MPKAQVSKRKKAASSTGSHFGLATSSSPACQPSPAIEDSQFPPVVVFDGELIQLVPIEKDDPRDQEIEVVEL